MSVLASHRKESKWEPIVYSEKLHDELLDLSQRDFGIKEMTKIVRRRYWQSETFEEELSRYGYLLYESKKRLNDLASLLTSNLRAANSIYPTTMHEYEQRRDFQNFALVNCEQIINELQHVVGTFYVDFNIFKTINYMIEREIRLIRKWRQRDNRIKRQVQDG